jgi:hypothetical protein
MGNCTYRYLDEIGEVQANTTMGLAGWIYDHRVENIGGTGGDPELE